MPLEAPILPGAGLRPPEADREKLGKFCVEVTDQLQRDNKDFFTRIDTYWKWYEAQPLVERRSTPFSGASNVVVPLVKIHSDAIKARMTNTVFAAPDVWTFRSHDLGVRDVYKESTEFLNWAGDDNEFDLYTPSVSWFDEGTILGSSVQVLQWSSRKRYVFVPGEGGKPRAVPIELGRGPLFQQFPRECVLWESGKPISDSGYLVTQSRKSWAEMTTLEQFGEFDEGYLDKCKPEADASGASIRETKSDAAGQKDPTDLYDIRQMWVEWPVLRGVRFEKLGDHDRGTPLLPLLVTFDYTTGTVLKVRGKPYYTRGWPAYEYKFRSGASHRNPAGIARMLEGLQRGCTNSLNQMIDTVTLANSMTTKTTDRRLLGAKFVPGQPVYVDKMDDLDILSNSKMIAPDISALNLMFGIAERLTGINDPSLGREIRYGGHPSPATSTALMLQESKETARASTQQVRLEVSRMGEDVLTLYQQFESQASGFIERIVGTADGEVTKRWRLPTGPIGGSLELDLKAMTEQLNPEAQREQAIFTMQATASYYSQVLQLFQAAANPQFPPAAKMAAAKAIEALSKGFERVLDAAQVDDVRQYVLDLQRSQFAPGPANQITNALTDNLASVAGDRGQRPLPPIQTGPGGLPMGGQGAPGANGI